MSNLELIVGFALATLLLFTCTYFFFDRGKREQAPTERRRPFNITFARLFGLITVAFIGAALTFTSVATEFATSAYTLLGTIAGYLAGASPTTTNTGAGAGANTGAGTQPPAGGPESEAVL